MMGLMGVYWYTMDAFLLTMCWEENAFFQRTLLTPAGERRILQLVEAPLLGSFKNVSVKTDSSI